jgi:hypothetical protein
MTMAKDKKSPKGNGGGKQNAIRLGNVGAATAASEDGRARKRQDRHGRAVAKEHTFAQLVAQASTDEHMLIAALDGFYQGELVALELEKDVMVGTVASKVTGTIILLIDMLGKQPAAMVVASTYSPIKAHVEWRLPLYTLMVQGFVSANMNPHLAAWINELAGTLQIICVEAIEERRNANRVRKQQGHQLPNRQRDFPTVSQFSATTPTLQLGVKSPKEEVLATGEPPKVAKPKARPLMWQRIKADVGYFTHDDLFYDGCTAGSAFIRQKRVAGARKLVLEGVTLSHPLLTTWEKVTREHVMIDVADVFPKGPITATSSDDTPMRAARREFARYLRERYDELLVLDPDSAGKVPVTQLEYDPLELRGIY